MTVETDNVTKLELLDEDQEQNERIETKPEDSEQPPEQKKHPDFKEVKRRQQIRSAIKPLYEIRESGEFDDSKIVEMTDDWAKKHGSKAENLTEILKYFELSESIIDRDFPPEQRVEIACALAEIISDPSNNIDAETLEALSYKIIYGGASGTMNLVCEYSANFPSMKIYDELFEDFDGASQNISHILKHEISHALITYGGVGKSETMGSKLDGLIEDAQNLKSRESYRVVNAIEQYLAIVGKENISPQEVEIMRSWLKTEIRAEKIAAYLQSGGEIGGFLTALWKVLPPETAKKIKEDEEFRKSWAEENRVFFEEIKNDMADKANLKANILKNSEAARAPMDAEDFDFEEMFEQSFKEGAVPDNTKSPQIQAKTGSLWEATKQLFAVFAEKAEEIVPVSEMAKKEAA
ncbi:MAG: hypothetical protein WC451_03685 [Patescibacteria group bacterium]